MHTVLPLGSQIPDFWLPDYNGKIYTKEILSGASAAMIFFLCNQGNHVHYVLGALVKLLREYEKKGVSALAINPNDIALSPDDRPDKMREMAIRYNYTFPYLFDGTQEVTKTLGASCIPDFFIFTREGYLAYHGRMDDSNPENGRMPNGKHLRKALDAVLKEDLTKLRQRSSYGNAIKWHPGNEPSYLYSPKNRRKVLQHQR